MVAYNAWTFLLRYFAGNKLYVTSIFLAAAEHECYQSSKMHIECVKVEGGMSFRPHLKQSSSYNAIIN